MTNFFPDFIKKLVGQTLSNFKDNARSDLSRKLKRLIKL